MIKRKSNFIFTFCCLIVICFGFISCDTVFEPTDIKEGGKKNPILLTEDKWTNGKLLDPASGGSDEQWFYFVATADTQYVYVKFSTLEVLKASIYDKDLNMIGTSVQMQGDSGTVADFSRQLTKDEAYYIKIERVDSWSRPDTGSYWIGFTDFPARPEKTIPELNIDTWINSTIDPNSGGDSYDWYTFTATSSTQYIHVKFSTLEILKASIYDKDLNMIGTSVQTQGDSGTVANFSRQLTKDESYYIKIEKGSSYGYSNTGSYWITFNNSGSAPF